MEVDFNDPTVHCNCYYYRLKGDGGQGPLCIPVVMVDWEMYDCISLLDVLYACYVLHWPKILDQQINPIRKLEL